MNALRTSRIACCCLAVTLVVAGCGGGSKSSSSGSGASATSTTGRTTGQNQITQFRAVNKYKKPKNPGPHPNAKIDQLVIKDIVRGRGPVLHAGDTGVFDFISTDYVSGAPIEESWHRKREFETRIDHGIVIDGWWQGIPGMRVGGRRQLIIPASLGFTQSVNPSVIGKITYFDVILVALTPAQPSGPGEAAGAQTTPALSAAR